MLTCNFKRVIIQIKVKKGDEAMEFLNRVLGIRVVYLDDAPTSMPNFISARYRIQKVILGGKEVEIFKDGE